MTIAQAVRWPWPRHASCTPHPARRLLDRVRGLPVIGWEASCKLGPSGIASGRLLAGLRREQCAPARWRQLPEEYGMPLALREDCCARLPHAARVLLAYEQSGDAAVAKLYLESDARRHDVPGAQLTIVGYKWPMSVADERATTPLRVTEYWQLDGLNPASSMRALRERDAADPCAPVHALLAQTMVQAAESPDWRYRHLTVREAGVSRACTLGFHGSGLSAEALRQPVQALAADWALPASEVEALFDAIGARTLAWLAAGSAADGSPFLTIYCEADERDALQAWHAVDPVPASDWPDGEEAA